MAVLLVMQVESIEKLFREVGDIEDVICTEDIANVGVISKSRDARIGEPFLFVEKVRPKRVG